jgi:hypothetical protein
VVAITNARARTSRGRVKSRRIPEEEDLKKDPNEVPEKEDPEEAMSATRDDGLDKAVILLTSRMSSRTSHYPEA